MNRFPSVAFVLPLLAFAVAQSSAGAPVAQEEDFAFEVGTEAYVLCVQAASINSLPIQYGDKDR